LFTFKHKYRPFRKWFGFNGFGVGEKAVVGSTAGGVGTFEDKYRDSGFAGMTTLVVVE
jgi:hypothetical protein